MLDKIDLLKARAEEFERNFYSLRNIEWKVIFQTYSGYAIISIAYNTSRSFFISERLPSLIFILILSILWAGSFYTAHPVLERLHFTKAMQNQYLKKMHELLQCEELSLPANIRAPIHKNWWAFVPQQILSTVALITIIAFIIHTTKWHP